MSRLAQDNDAKSWKCGSCKIRNRKNATFCQSCGGHWERVYVDEDTAWEWSQADGYYNQRPRSTSAKRRGRSTRQPTDGKGKGKDKGKEKGKEKSKDKIKDLAGDRAIGPLPSPFQYQSSPSIPPWPAQDAVSPFAPALVPPSASSQHQELLAALKKAYTESAMPQDVKELLERHETSGAKQVTKDLHTATTMLGKSQKALKDAQQQRQTHRASWIAHLTESIKIWEDQLEDFRKRQMSLREAEQKAAQDIKSARTTIQQLNQVAGTTAQHDVADQLQEETVETADNEEQQLRQKLQQTLANCATALGIQQFEIHSDGEVDEQTRAKRARSQEKEDKETKEGGKDAQMVDLTVPSSWPWAASSLVLKWKEEV